MTMAPNSIELRDMMASSAFAGHLASRHWLSREFKRRQLRRFRLPACAQAFDIGCRNES